MWWAHCGDGSSLYAVPDDNPDDNPEPEAVGGATEAEALVAALEAAPR
jgi:hypothetical protein